MRKKKNRKLAIVIFLVLVIGLFFSKQTLARKDYFAHESWEKIFARENIVDYPIVFIHGIIGHVGHWEKVMKTMVGSNFHEMRYYENDTIYHNYFLDEPDHWLWSVSYYTMNPIEESFLGDMTLYARRLQRMIHLIKKMTGQKKVVLIAHSMGGLVARKYMTLDQECWNSVHKILTVGTPNEGVGTSIPVVGQLEDLRRGSDFLEQLDQDWSKFDQADVKWGVIGAIDQLSVFNLNPLGTSSPKSTDSAGPGFIQLSSAIPFGEWEVAFNEYFEEVVYNTEHFGFRLAVHGTHMGLLYHEGTFEGIHWAIRK